MRGNQTQELVRTTHRFLNRSENGNDSRVQNLKCTLKQTDWMAHESRSWGWWRHEWASMGQAFFRSYLPCWKMAISKVSSHQLLWQVILQVDFVAVLSNFQHEDLRKSSNAQLWADLDLMLIQTYLISTALAPLVVALPRLFTIAMTQIAQSSTQDLNKSDNPRNDDLLRTSTNYLTKAVTDTIATKPFLRSLFMSRKSLQSINLSVL